MAKRPLPRITEAPPSQENAELVVKVAQDAANFLNIDPKKLSPQQIVAKVDDFVYRLQKGKARAPDGEDRDILFGCLWGQQLVAEFEWEWANVVFHEHDDSKAMGVFSRDRSLAIYPFHFIYGCIENGAPVTIALSFNMLLAERIPKLPARGYENLMDGVHHIVPRD
jgi:hypothetical protein